MENRFTHVFSPAFCVDDSEENLDAEIMQIYGIMVFDRILLGISRVMVEYLKREITFDWQRGTRVIKRTLVDDFIGLIIISLKSMKT